MAIGNVAKRFGVPVKIPGGYFNGRMLRDHFKRQLAAEKEVEVSALRFIARNTTLPLRARIQAQLQLAAMPKSNHVQMALNRCTLTGRGRAVMLAFRLNRFIFREHAKKGWLSGVVRGMW